MNLLYVLFGASALSLAIGSVVRWAYLAGRADRITEKRLRSEYQALHQQLTVRLETLESEDAKRRRQLHDLVVEYEAVVGPTSAERVQQIIQETAVMKSTGPQSQRERYGLR